MIIDARKINQQTALQTEVCIIGGGMAGITIALELKKQGIDSFILESGGLSPDKFTQDLYRGNNIGLPYTFADGSRSRYLGGSSNCWGGWCAPLDKCDFEKRDWVNYSGWPIDRSELEPYYQRSHSILKLGPYNYDPSYWENTINRSDVRRMPFTTNKVRDTISQFSPPARFRVLYKDELEDTNHITTFLYANVTNIETIETDNVVTAIEVTTIAGNTFSVSAKIYVLATGGIENARLLLNSNKTQPNGLGNGNDLIGRFFMDHPRLYSGRIRFTKQWLQNKLYDVKYHYRNAAVSANDTFVGSQFALCPATMQQEGLLNARVSFASFYFGEGTDSALAMSRFKSALFEKKFEGFSFRKDIFTVVSHPLEVVGFGLAKQLKFRSLIKDVRFQIIIEQQPNPASRITLSHEKDPLGMNRINVNWQLGEIERRTFKKTLSILAGELKDNGSAEKITLDCALENGDLCGLTGTWHHMGTTRMHDSPKQGVVDRNCCVHGMSNLYIAGSSVFPTGGANFPTITLIALALRLSDHIKDQLKK